MTDIGAMLREARMRENLDIAEFESRSKIRAKYLRALEDEEWGLLPGYTFTKSFLRTYADMLGLDGRMLVDEFKRQYPDPSENEPAPLPPSRRPDSRRPRERGGGDRGGGGRRAGGPSGPSGRVLLAALLVVLLAAAVFVVRELEKGKGSGGTTTTTSTTTTRSRTTSSRTNNSGGTATGTKRRVTVSLQIHALSPVHVCLIGFTTHGFPHQRLPVHGASAPLAVGARAPTYHADRYFLVSFSGGRARMVLARGSVTVDATTTALAYKVTRTAAGVLAATQAPHCK